MAADLNMVALVGRLTKDPEVRHLQSGTALCEIRLAFSTRKKSSDGEWGDKSNYIDVKVWGERGERIAQHLSKGRRIGVKGRLEWSEWETEGGSKRQKIEISADDIQYLDPRQDGESGGQGGSEVYQPSGQFGSSVPDDDIPF